VERAGDVFTDVFTVLILFGFSTRYCLCVRERERGGERERQKNQELFWQMHCDMHRHRKGPDAKPKTFNPETLIPKPCTRPNKTDELQEHIYLLLQYTHA
jgi:hypothetical protein